MLCSECKGFLNPTPTVDIIAIKYIDNLPYIVLIERKNEPFGWALPGGFIDYGEGGVAAAIRELFEETNLRPVSSVYQFKTYTDPDRDPRQHNISIVYWCVVAGELKAKDDAVNAELVFPAGLDLAGPNDLALPVGALTTHDLELVFDHKKIIEEFFLTRD